MQTTQFGNTGLVVSRIGIGGHYQCLEPEGMYDERSGYVDREVANRVPIIQRAIDAGVSFFDTTWRNEVSMLSRVLGQVSFDRSKIVINSMVLGAFSGSKHFSRDVLAYFDEGLDIRLREIPGGYFDAFMINAIEEKHNEAACDRLVAHLEKRRAKDFKLLGFSSHDPVFARKMVDRYPAFSFAMIPYNFHNRVFETAFADYSGNVFFAAMKPLVWHEYGVPFCALSKTPHFRDNFGFVPSNSASTAALRSVLNNQRIGSVVCAINSMAELEAAIAAGAGAFSDAESKLLANYNKAIIDNKQVPLFIGALKHKNLRMAYFGYEHLCEALKYPVDESIELNAESAFEKVQSAAEPVLQEAMKQGWGKFIN